MIKQGKTKCTFRLYKENNKLQKQKQQGKPSKQINGEGLDIIPTGWGGFLDQSHLCHNLKNMCKTWPEHTLYISKNVRGRMKREYGQFGQCHNSYHDLVLKNP